MKKLLAIAIALALVLSLSVTAMATDNELTPAESPYKDTEVTFSVAPTYTVTIPATIELSKADDGTYQKIATIQAENVRLEEGENLQVTITGDFMLSNGSSYQLPYTVKAGNSVITSGGVVATFTTSTTAQSSTLSFAAANPQYAGVYSDTVTFTISIVDVTPTETPSASDDQA